LEEQISIIKPVIILILGRVAADALLKMNTTLTKYRENIHFYNGIKTYVTYHPSALLRNPGWKKYAWIDLQKLRDDYNNLEY
jgi:DNA polymerase